MFEKLFRRTAKQPEQQGVAPGTSISYDASLIERFEGHHQTLLKLFGQIGEAAEERHYEQIQAKLTVFRRVLDQHLLEENLRLYIYLHKCLANDADTMVLIEDMKQEMGRIGRTVRDFIRHYTDYGVTADNVVKFNADLAGIGEALVDRIRREEGSLYTLYMPPGDYA